jgi:hypothetical protein
MHRIIGFSLDLLLGLLAERTTGSAQSLNAALHSKAELEPVSVRANKVSANEFRILKIRD